MRAARYYGKEDMRVEEIEEPVCGEGQLKIRPAFVGICGTDLHEYLGGPNFAPVTPHPVTHATLPVTFGHEFSGTITEIGKSVTGWKVGQKVAIQPTISDGSCSACLSHLENVCHNGGFVGLSGWGGGLSDAVTISESYALALPENIPLDIGALVEPLSVGWHAVSLSPISGSGGESVLILGGGPIGIAVILALRAKGVGRIIVSEPSKKRAEFVRGFGADEVLDPVALGKEGEGAFEEKVKGLNGGEGVDVGFDCAGVAVGLGVAWEKPVPFQPNDLVFREGKYVACLGYVKKDFEDVIKAIASGAMKPGDMITSKIALENVVDDGI